MRSFARSGPQDVPALASLMPPVSGDFPPTETRAEEGAIVPVTTPVEKIN